MLFAQIKTEAERQANREEIPREFRESAIRVIQDQMFQKWRTRESESELDDEDHERWRVTLNSLIIGADNTISSWYRGHLGIYVA
jgi:hypothetical protein